MLTDRGRLQLPAFIYHKSRNRLQESGSFSKCYVEHPFELATELYSLTCPATKNIAITNVLRHSLLLLLLFLREKEVLSGIENLTVFLPTVLFEGNVSPETFALPYVVQ